MLLFGQVIAPSSEGTHKLKLTQERFIVSDGAIRSCSLPFNDPGVKLASLRAAAKATARRKRDSSHLPTHLSIHATFRILYATGDAGSLEVVLVEPR